MELERRVGGWVAVMSLEEEEDGVMVVVVV